MRGPSQQTLIQLLHKITLEGSYHDDGTFVLETGDNEDDVIQQAGRLIDEFEQANHNHTAYVNSLPIVEALWWFIDNCAEDDLHRQDYFHVLRERVRQHTTEGDAFDMIGRHVARESRLAADKMTADTWYDLRFKMKYAPVAQISDVQLIKVE